MGSEKRELKEGYVWHISKLRNAMHTLRSVTVANRIKENQGYNHKGNWTATNIRKLVKDVVSSEIPEKELQLLAYALAKHLFDTMPEFKSVGVKRALKDDYLKDDISLVLNILPTEAEKAEENVVKKPKEPRHAILVNNLYELHNLYLTLVNDSRFYYKLSLTPEGTITTTDIRRCINRFANRGLHKLELRYLVRCMVVEYQEHDFLNGATKQLVHMWTKEQTSRIQAIMNYDMDKFPIGDRAGIATKEPIVDIKIETGNYLSSSKEDIHQMMNDSFDKQYEAIKKRVHQTDYSGLEQRVAEHAISQGYRLEDDKIVNPCNEVVLGKAADCVIMDSLSSIHETNQTKTGETTMSNFETKHYVQGHEINQIGNERLFGVIAELEGEIKNLSKIQVKSKAVEKKIKQLHKDIANIVKHVDKRV